MIPVIDLFAGPGGLGEGFSALRDDAGRRVFRIGLSIEKDPAAHKTLLLRSFFRQFEIAPNQYYSYVRGELAISQLIEAFPTQYGSAQEEALCVELGKHDWTDIDSRIRRAIGDFKNWVLIGGPPCQAYSLVGRSRMRNKNPQKFGRDKRHLLYREYLRILAVHRPPVFVMENVKGILSSQHKKEPIINKIIADLKHPLDSLPELKTSEWDSVTYDIQSLVDRVDSRQSSLFGKSPRDFVIRFEQHGIPQARHRVLLVGIRSDISRDLSTLTPQKQIAMWNAVQDLPEMRSRLSGEPDSPEAWLRAIGMIRDSLGKTSCGSQLRDFIHKSLGQLTARQSCGGEFMEWRRRSEWASDWFHDARLGGVLNHTSRGHIASDLQRYFFAACFAKVRNRSPKIEDFPIALLPKHKNIKKKNTKATIFADRFRVQIASRPATTITSHISKDGHYFIHPDPLQARSLTVREAARLQTFPDNYYFEGPRTSQYHQVGNAVPPLIAREVAKMVADLLG